MNLTRNENLFSFPDERFLCVVILEALKLNNEEMTTKTEVRIDKSR